jgi:hypothetical protein
VNQLNYTVENGGAIYTNPSGIILSASRICRLDGLGGIPQLKSRAGPEATDRSVPSAQVELPRESIIDRYAQAELGRLVADRRWVAV